MSFFLTISRETFTFNHIIQQLMDLMDNYPFEKEVFLRELIFNASDALDKVRHKSLTDRPLQAEPNFCIRIIPDKTQKTLTILDAGIGMTKQELIYKLGAYVKPGAQAFIEAVKSGTDMSTIAPFGVGFYSVFLVAEKVVVMSKSEDSDKQYKWEFTGGSTYTVAEDDSNPDQLARGTKIILHLKNNSLEFLEENRLKEIILKHSECIGFPIELQVWEPVNKARPIWTRRPDTVTMKEYSRFYRSVTNSGEGFLGVKHFAAEGQFNFSAVLFIPTVVNFNPFGIKKNIRLYVRRIFVMDDCEELIPEYLNFVRGVVDSEDLPLNIPIEELRKNDILKPMKHIITKKVLELIEELSEDPRFYQIFYEQFSEGIKLGVYQDNENRAKLCEFLRFYTSKSGDQQISLKEYVSRMKEGQKYIYYLTGKPWDDAAKSPFLQRMQNKDYEVIYMIDPMDDCVIQQVSEYYGKRLKDCTRKRLGLAARIDETNRNLMNEGHLAGDLKMQETI